MKIILAKTKLEITYDENYVHVKNNLGAIYDSYTVTQLSTYKAVGKIYNVEGEVRGKPIFGNYGEFKACSKDCSLRNVANNTVVATYDGTPEGAIASYLLLAYLDYKKKEAAKRKNTPNPEAKKDSAKKGTSTSNSDKSNPKENAATSERSQTSKVKTENLNREFQNIETPQKERFEYKEPPKDYQPREPKMPLPSGGSSESSGAGCLGFVILAIVLVIAISLIPQSWNDLSEYIPKGDPGIIISFFSAVIGGIIAIAMAILIKEPKFISCMSGFLGSCGVGVAISAIWLLNLICTGEEKFSGFILFDIPLCFFAPILGSFQFAFPIGIGVAVICGIICLIKSRD